MRQQQDGLARARAAIAHHQVGLLRDGAAHKDVRRGESGSLQPRRHSLGDRRRRAGGEPGLALDHLLVDFPRQALVGRRRHDVRAQAAPGKREHDR